LPDGASFAAILLIVFVVLPQEFCMSLLLWLTIGLLTGFIASCAVNRGGPGFWAYINVGLASAVLGGLMADMLGLHGVQRVNWFNVLAALATAIIVLVLFRRAQLRFGWEFPPLPDEV
jgi:uncharacterized membrane protein YeaQ/YmgE (transglycosylase-associated protein family)